MGRRSVRSMIFIDTGALIAQALRRDQHHAESTAVWDELGLLGDRFITSSFVLDELFTYLARRASYRFAAGRARDLYDSQLFDILRPDEEDERRALGLFEKYADQKVSFTDCISFALMRRHRIGRVFTFDRHFALAGFEVIPGHFGGSSSGWVSEGP
jgi:predicted nucleic acid-binding protein